MRRIAPALPVPADMLRHFAVLTLVITGGLALFAHGESETNLANQIKQRQMRTEALRAERERATQHTVVIDGLRIAPGTRLAPADVAPPGDMVVNEAPLSPTAMEDFPQAPSAPIVPVAPAAASGPAGRAGPMPPPAMMMRQRKPGQPAAKPGQGAMVTPAPPSERDVRAMIEASAQRAGAPASQ